MRIFSPHRQRMEAKRRFGSKEFQNKIKKAQNYKRVFDPRTRTYLGNFLHKLKLDSRLTQLAVAIVVLGAAYYLFISPYFLVTEVTVAGTRQLSVEQVQEPIKNAPGRWLFIPKKHLFLLSKSYAEELITSQLPLVKEIAKYKRSWPNKVEIEIVERTPGFAFNVNGVNYLVDEEGVVVRELSETAGLVLVTDQVNEPIQVGEKLNNIKLIAFILSSIHQWPNKINSDITEIKVPGKAATQIQLISSEGWGVFLDTTRPVESQLSNLSLLLTRQIPAQSRLRLAYIDLRFDKWAYYCYKNEPCEAQPQETTEQKTEEEKIPIQ